VSRSKEKREAFKADLALFVKQIVKKCALDEEGVYQDVVDEWRMAYSEKRMPRITQKDVAERLGTNRQFVEKRIHMLIDAGRLIRSGGSRMSSVLVPNEKEFTG